MMTTAGSLALVGSIPPEDSTVARKLREAGAVLLGKPNLIRLVFAFEQATRFRQPPGFLLTADLRL